MDKYLVDIISRMNDETDQTVQSGYNSSDTISWKAFREAEKIDNASYIPVSSRKRDVKNSAKFAIESIKKRIEK